MKEEKFKVIQFIRELILAVDKELENYPKKELEIKNRIRTCTYDILEIAYEANVTTDIELKKNLLNVNYNGNVNNNNYNNNYGGLRPVASKKLWLY